MAKPARPRNTKGNVEREFDMLARKAKLALKTYANYVAHLERMGIEGRHMIDAKHVHTMLMEHSLIEGWEYDVPHYTAGAPATNRPIMQDFITKIFDQVTPAKKRSLLEKGKRKKVKLDDIESTRPQIALEDIEVADAPYEAPVPMPGFVFNLPKGHFA
ncbi:hypothetical protein [Pseudomonas sp.]|uniref:hypothetical protein n=1 Tax=Pseudomonas sp. TaxID=306 RepID=UPI002FCC2EE4